MFSFVMKARASAWQSFVSFDLVAQRAFSAFIAVFCILAGCSGAPDGAPESTGSVREADTTAYYCPNQVLTDANVFGGVGTVTSASLSGTYNGYLPNNISITSGSPTNFTAMISLTVPTTLGSTTCVYNYPLSGGAYQNPVNACVPPPHGSCSYVWCPFNPVGHLFTNATNVTLSVKRTAAGNLVSTKAVFGSDLIDDGNSCTDDSCVGAVANHAATPAGTLRSDGNACNGVESCDGNKNKISTGPLPDGTPCSDGNACDVAVCASQSCTRTKYVPSGTVCAAGNVCTGLSTCNGLDGACHQGPAPTVGASTVSADQCTIADCDPAAGVYRKPNPNAPPRCAADNKPTGSDVDQTVPTSVADSARFLYESINGSIPPQTLPIGTTLDDTRVSIIRGQVMNKATSANPTEAPLAGVTVSVLGHDAFGTTQTNANGWFSMAVEGGGSLTFKYSYGTFISVQRTAQTRWHDYTVLPLVKMMAPESSSAVTLSSTSSGQFIRGVVHGAGGAADDSDGTRQASIYIPPGVVASDPALNNVPIHITTAEFTAGPSGPAAMPGDLPANSAYTYAVDLSITEAASEQVKFQTSAGTDASVIFYVEGFEPFQIPSAAGTSAPVPTGYYDETSGVWVPAASGQLVKVSPVSLQLNTATFDAADSDFNPPLAPGERAMLESTYGLSLKTIWRVALPHFSKWDLNWGAAFPSGVPDPRPHVPLAKTSNPVDRPCPTCGSIIESQNQVLAEEIPVAGTPYFLRYQSERAAGRLVHADIPITGNTPLPTSLKRIDVDVMIAGTHGVYSFSPTTPLNSSFRFKWDGTDAFGRPVQGGAWAYIKIGYVYPLSYGSPNRFGGTPSSEFSPFITANRAAAEITAWQFENVHLNAFNELPFGLGGWSLSAEAAYDPETQVLYGGDGDRLSSPALPPITTQLTKASASGYLPPDGDPAPYDKEPATSLIFRFIQAIAAAPDGSVFFASFNAVFKLTNDGIVHWIAGTNKAGTLAQSYSGDPRLAPLQGVNSLAVDSNGVLYIGINPAVVKVVPATSTTPSALTVFAGHSDLAAGFGGDGGSATGLNARLGTTIHGLAVGNDGGVYIADEDNLRIRRVTPDGILDTFAGNGSSTVCTGSSGALCENALALNAAIHPWGISCANDGSVYFSDRGQHTVRKIGVDGRVNTVAGIPQQHGTGTDLIQATQSLLYLPSSVVAANDGSFFEFDPGNYIIGRVDSGGTISAIAGNYQKGDTDLINEPIVAPSGQAEISSQSQAMSVSPNGSIYYADLYSLKRVSGTLPGFSGATVSVPSRSGNEIYVFGPECSGGTSAFRHCQTLDRARGVVLQTLAYDAKGLLHTVTDRDGNITTIDHDSDGKPTAITAP